ncbi:MAG: tRNA uridine(34) 5-carboxymethylaminomethyl modification radical SAM/GNAT enzyme Elp3 [Nanoarchaeota archaeon]|nr:tRNA uridine(34) 5-carboxymethylaminomethyl modification radical SAM/GNAT enzyme Elp3 [Nanoarchaeota archaeon]
MDDEFYMELIEEIIKSNTKDTATVKKIRRALCRKYKANIFPSFIQILTHANQKQYHALKFLISKPTRTISGVAPLAIMSKPFPCPHGKCIFCPGGPDSYFGNIPQSYTGNEPAAMRGLRNNFDPYLQTYNRLEQYQLLNQNLDKIELIIMGGTFPSYPKQYQNNFIKFALKAMNDYGEIFHKNEFNFQEFKDFFLLPCSIKDKNREKKIIEKISKLKGKTSLETEKLRNESSKIRCIALAIETRPDFCKKPEINTMLNQGCTRVELGVQTVYNDILKKSKRGHSVEDSIEATRLMKDSFLKVGYHIMPGLLGSTKEKDINIFKEIFTNEDFKPDFLKIYPCMVMPGTELNELYKKGKYEPLATKDAARIIAEGKTCIPKYCRVQRVQRDIPSKFIVKGVDVTNLRQYVEKQMKQKCRCIRCSEPKNKGLGATKLFRMDYNASQGQEIFLSIEDDKGILAGFCRLRKPCLPFRKEITENSMGVRELHVYSPSLRIGRKDKSSIQHRGYGQLLMKEAEKIAKEDFDCKKLLVIAGIGVKEYFIKKLHYTKDGTYVSKKI